MSQASPLVELRCKTSRDVFVPYNIEALEAWLTLGEFDPLVYTISQK